MRKAAALTPAADCTLRLINVKGCVNRAPAGTEGCFAASFITCLRPTLDIDSPTLILAAKGLMLRG
jgi:hypothetical protein